MYFSICNSLSIKNYNLRGNKSVLIRILESTYKTNGIPYQINNINEYKNILELYINDTTNNTNNENIFNYEKAKLLNNFILNNDFDEIVIHCSLGLSRSPTIMICIAKILNNIELENIIKEKYKFYNSYIVDIFENTNYSIKKLNTNIKIDGNILDEKLSPCDSIKYIRILKKMNKNIRIIN